MAARLNKKFALTLAVVSITAAVTLTGLGLLAYRANTTRHIKAGDQLMASGEYELALKEYGRAVAKEKSELSHLQKFEDALLRIRPQTQEQARQYYGQLTGVMRHKLLYDPFDANVHIELLEELRGIARLINRSSTWDPIYDAAADMETGVSKSDPLYPYAKLYRGLASLRRNPVPSDAQVRDALRDLSEFVEAVPDSDVGWAGRVEALYASAQLARASGNNRAADDALAEADEMLKLAVQAVDDGPEVTRLHALRLLQRQELGDATITPEEVAQAVDRMVELIIASNDPMLLLRATDILRYADRTEGISKGVRILADYLVENPEDHLQRFALANLYFRDDSFDDARSAAQEIIDAEPVLVSLLAIYQPQLRIRAAALIVDIEFEAWERAAEDQRATQLLRTKSARDRLADLVATPEKEPLMLHAEGKIAMAENNFVVAADMFERAVRIAEVPDFEILWYAARALEQIDEFGSALMRIDDALEERPGSVYLLRQKARLEARLARFDDAMETIEQALRRDPENEQTQLLAARIRQGRITGRSIVVDAVARAISNAKTAGDAGDLDAARTILLDAMREHGADESRLLYFLALLEIEAEQLDDATGFLDRAIQLQPNNGQLLSLRASLGIDDPVERLEQALSARYANEPDRSLTILLGLRRRASEWTQLADRHAAADDAASEDSTRDLATRANQRADVALVRAREVAAGHPTLLNHLLGEAIRAEDWDSADAVLQQAREQNTDQADGLIFRGRYELARSQTEKAVQTLIEASNRKPYSAIPWQLLGRAYELLGSNTEARHAYQEAYSRDPADRVVVTLYVSLLERIEDKTRALSVLRSSRRLVDRDPQLQDAWLRLEADVGNSVLAIQKRRVMYDLFPGNRLNAMRLAELLGRADPSFEHIVDESGVSEYDLDHWRALSIASRTELMEETTAQWIAESNEIFDNAKVQSDDSLELAFLRASVVRSRGEIAAGQQILRDYLDRQQEDKLTGEMFVALGRYQMETNQGRDAQATLERGRAYQDPQRREADRALIELFFAGNAYKEGIDLCDQLLAIEYERTLALRVVQGYIGLGEFDQADQHLRTLVEADGADFRSAMLDASIAGRQADQLYLDGEPGLAAEKYRTQRRVLAGAKSLQPDDPVPHVQTAQSLLHEFKNSGMRSLLDEALVALDSADEVRASTTITSTVRVDVQLAMGDVRAAIGELTRLVQRSPDNFRARAVLASLYENQGERNSALRTIDDAIERFPLMATWHSAKGDLLRRQNQLEPAARAYAEAYRLTPSNSRLTVLTETLLSLKSPDIRQILEMFAATESSLDAEPALRSLYARALDGGGQREAALDQLRTAYREYRAKEDQAEAIAAHDAWLRALQELFSGSHLQDLEPFVLDVSDQNPSARELNAMARIWLGSGPDGQSHAMELQQRALDQVPEDDTQLRTRMLLEMGLFALSGEDYQAAVEAFDRAIELEPNNPTALNNAAFVNAEELGEFSKALGLAERANEARPDDPGILDTLGWIHYRLQQYEQAETALRRSNDLRESAETLYHLACVLFKQDRLGPARTYLNRASELEPDPKTRDEMERLEDDITRARNR